MNERDDRQECEAITQLSGPVKKLMSTWEQVSGDQLPNRADGRDK